jgi:hypothetical protein
VLPSLETSAKDKFPGKLFKFELSEDGEQLRVHYPSLFEDESNYLQKNVFVEFGGRNSTEPRGNSEVWDVHSGDFTYHHQ